MSVPVDLDAIRARHASADRAARVIWSHSPDQAHADRGALLDALTVATADRDYAVKAFHDLEREWRDRTIAECAAAQAALDRLAEVVAEDIAVVLWGMDTQDCDRMGAAVLTFLRARVKGP